MRVLTRVWRLCLLAVTASCGITDVEAPALAIDEEVGEPFVEEIDAALLEAIVAAGPAEVEIFFLDDGVTAGEVAVRTEAFSDSESIQSSVASLDEAGGRLILDLGGIEVTFEPATRFWLGSEAVDRETVLDRVRQDLASGRRTPLVVERAPVGRAQGAEDDTFVAQDVIVGGDGTPSLRMLVGPGDFILATETASLVQQVSSFAAGKPDAWIKVLGCMIRLHVRDGRTHVMRHRHHYHRVVRFDGAVESIDLGARTLLLDDGTTVRVTGRTGIVRGHDHARSLRAAAEAMQNGFEVRAHGLGVTERHRTLLALRLALEVEEAEADPEPEPVVLEFEGAVVDVRPGEGGNVVELANGTVVRIGAATEWVAVDEHSPASVDALEHALADGRLVIARGRGEVVDDAPLVLRGLRIELQGEAPPPDGDLVSFSGIVDYVESTGSVVLMDGTMVVLTDATVLVGAGENSPATVPELQDALDRNRRVELRGEGTLGDEMVVTAASVELVAVLGTFDTDVSMIDPDTGGLILVGGSFALLTDATIVTAVGDGPTDLAGIDAALGAGDRVRARGSGFVRGRFAAPDRVDNYEVIAVEFERIP